MKNIYSLYVLTQTVGSSPENIVSQYSQYSQYSLKKVIYSSIVAVI